MRIPLALFFVVIILGCVSNSNKPKIPLRPVNVSTEAFWVGGTDGGKWYLVGEINDHKNSVGLKVFNDYDGSLFTTGKFVIICPESNVMSIQDLSKQIKFFDGEKIYLQASGGKRPCWLQNQGL